MQLPLRPEPCSVPEAVPPRLSFPSVEAECNRLSWRSSAALKPQRRQPLVPETTALRRETRHGETLLSLLLARWRAVFIIQLDIMRWVFTAGCSFQYSIGKALQQLWKPEDGLGRSSTLESAAETWVKGFFYSWLIR